MNPSKDGLGSFSESSNKKRADPTRSLGLSSMPLIMCRIDAYAANEYAFDFEAGTENHYICQLIALNAAHVTVHTGEFRGRKRSHANDIWQVLTNRSRHSLHHPIHSVHRAC